MAKLNRFVPGVNTTFSTELNQNHEIGFNNSSQVAINQLIDRDVTRSNDGVSPFVEAYIDADGRKNSVDTANTTALLDLSSYKPWIKTNNASLTTNDPDSFTNADNFFDENTGTGAVKTGSVSGTQTVYLGKTFSSRGVGKVSIKWTVNVSGSSTTRSQSIILQSFNGSVWTDEVTLASGSSIATSYDDSYYLNKVVQGVRIKSVSYSAISNTHTHTAYEYTMYDSSEAIITHSIPSGTFSPTVSSGIAAVKIVDWEEGASLQWKAISQDYDGTTITEDYSSGTTTSQGATTLQTMKITPSQKCKIKSITVPNTASDNFLTVTVNSVAANFSNDIATFGTPVELLPNVEYTVTFTATSTMSVIETLIFPVKGKFINLTEDASGFAAGCSFIESMVVETLQDIDDTGYQDFNISGTTAYAKISEFTAFTAEPTKFIVKLVPKTTTPIAGSPSISGVSIQLL